MGDLPFIAYFDFETTTGSGSQNFLDDGKCIQFGIVWFDFCFSFKMRYWLYNYS